MSRNSAINLTADSERMSMDFINDMMSVVRNFRTGNVRTIRNRGMKGIMTNLYVKAFPDLELSAEKCRRARDEILRSRKLCSRWVWTILGKRVGSNMLRMDAFKVSARQVIN